MAWKVSSWMEIIEIMDESLMVAMNWPASGGRIRVMDDQFLDAIVGQVAPVVGG